MGQTGPPPPPPQYLTNSKFDRYRRAIGKRITAHESTRSKPGNHNYCFVDFDTAEEASEAMKGLNESLEGAPIKISLARSIPFKLKARRDEGQYNRIRVVPSEDDPRPEKTSTTEPVPAGNNSGPRDRAMASRDWRRKDA